jgi:hypothetical protein
VGSFLDFRIKKRNAERVLKHLFFFQPRDLLAEGFQMSDLKELALSRFPFDTHQPIEVHTLCFEPGFQNFSGIGSKFREHFSFKHIHEHAFGFGHLARLHAPHQGFGALPGKACQRMLAQIKWHRRSRKNFKTRASTQVCGAD